MADSVVFLLSPDSGLDTYGEHCLSCLFAQGLPAPVLAVQVSTHTPQLSAAEEQIGTMS